MKVLIIIPVFNEEDALPGVLARLHAVCPQYDLLVINDGSADNTGTLAERAGYAKVIHLPYNLGIGGCVQTGFIFARNNNYDIAVQFDGDGQHNPEDISKLVSLVRSGTADVIIGSRFNIRDAGGFRSTNLRRIGIRVFQTASFLLVRQRITDHTSGFRAFNRRTIELLSERYPVDFPEPEVIIFLGKNRFRIREFFTQMYERQGGVSSIPLHKGPYYMLKVLLSMLMAALRSRI